MSLRRNRNRNRILTRLLVLFPPPAGLHGRTDREDSGQHRRLGHGAAGPVEPQGGAKSVRAERRSRQGQPAAERGQQLLLAGRRCPHRAGVSRGER